MKKIDTITSFVSHPTIPNPISERKKRILWTNRGYIDEPEMYRDAPISLQLVGRRYDDEKIIQALEFMRKHVEMPF